MKKSVFLSATKALYKKEELDVADHLKTVEGDDVPDELVLTIFKELDAEKVTKFKTENTERFNNGEKKGRETAAKKFEKKLREIFNVDDDDLIGDDLLTHIETNLPEPGKPGEGKADLSKLTAEELEKVPAFILKMKDINKQLKEKDTDKEKAIAAIKAEQETGTLLSEASQKALAVLDGKNPILPKDATKATTMKNKLLVDELKSHKFMKGTDGSLIPLDAEGKQALDAQGNPLDFSTLVDNIINANFEFNIVEPRKSPGNKDNLQPKPGDKEKVKYTGKAPATADEYMGLLLDDNLDTDQKVAMKEQFSEQFS